MKCPKCQFENRESAKFCKECGNKLEIPCSKCGNINEPGSKFCDECGQNLTIPPEPLPKDLSFDEKLDKIQRYLPKGLTEKILSQRNKIEGERKQVTVMFCDMEGFTPLVEKLGPEDAYGIMDEVYELLIHKVHDYEGTVNEMTGDGIMALFGAPVALEDAPQRAIRSALAIHREMTKFSNKIAQEIEGIQPLKMRIGVHTGPVVVGTLGNDLRIEFKAVGDTVNLASRMEGLAEPGTSYVTGETFKLTEGFFRFEGLGEREVKGRKELVNVYRVIAPSSRRTRFEVSTERGLTHFVGRERELELLLDGFERAKSGRGQAFSIMAEAGVGKSRLLYEFRKAVANEGATFLEGKCLSYSRSVAYHPVIDILKANFDIRDGDGDPEVKEKVKRQLKVLGTDEASTLPYLLELLSVKESGIDKIPMSPEGRKARIMEALKRIVLKGSEVRPLIIAVEDLHWIDKSSEDFFKDLLDRIAGAKIFLIFTYRPEFVHAWGGKSFHSQVNLNRLSNRESLTMATHFLGTEDMDGNVEQFILEKTEGVPFFIEEFIRSIRDLKIIEKKDNKYHMAKDIQDVTIPSTIQDVIMARVDSLPEGAKDLLQTGSVIEREFSYELIKRVTGFSEQALLSHLSALRDSELVYERGIFPQSTNVFKHALTRDVVYDSILTKTKKRLHGQIGDAIEELYKDNINEHYEVLAEHYIASENFENGAKYSKLSAKKAEKSASLNDAITYAKKRVASIEKLPQTDNVAKQLIDARTILGLYRAQLSSIAEAKKAIDPIFDLALKYDYKRRLSQLYTIVGAYNNVVEEDYLEASKHLGKALKISEEVNDIVSLVLANYFLGQALSFNCEFEKAYSHINKALEINEAVNNLWGIATMKSLIGTVYCWHGKIDLAYQTSSEALQIAVESGDIYSNALSYTHHGISCYGKGFFEEAIEHLLRGADFWERINTPIWDSLARHTLGDAYFDIGEYQESQNYYKEAVSILEQGGFLPSFSNLCKIGSARAKVMNNEKDINLKSVYGYHEKNRYRLFDGWMLRYIGEILLNIDDQHMSEAEEWTKKAIEADIRNDMRWHLEPCQI
ncbi:MAG: AAA family ATPase [Desulfobacteraceae bacterium]|nr:AAA family ATPase [Desulfobacteraceae bacterium]